MQFMGTIVKPTGSCLLKVEIEESQTFHEDPITEIETVLHSCKYGIGAICM
jgi:hypothetical protein